MDNEETDSANEFGKTYGDSQPGSKYTLTVVMKKAPTKMSEMRLLMMEILLVTWIVSVIVGAVQTVTCVAIVTIATTVKATAKEWIDPGQLM